MNKKTTEVMSALKSRGAFSEAKKGVNLLGIVQKLTAKRQALGGDTKESEVAESPTKVAKEAVAATKSN